MTVFHTAVAHDDVFRRTTVATVAVTAALDGDAVVAGVEVAAFDKHILAGIRITAIAIGTFVLHMDIADDHIVAECGVNHPERRAEHRHTFDKHILAHHWIDKLHTHAVTVAETALLYGHTLFIPFKKNRTADFLRHDSLFPAEMPCATHAPPVFKLTAAVESTLAGNGYVFLLESIDHRLIVIAVDTFPTSAHDRIFLQVRSKQQCGTLFKMKVDIALKRNRTCQPSSGRNHHTASAFLGTAVNNLVDEFCI